MNKEFYKTIYMVSNAEEVQEKDMDMLLMCSGINWNLYFTNINNKSNLDFDKIKNVELIEFNKENEMFDFWNSLDDNKKIDYSVEHEKPCLLKYS